MLELKTPSVVAGLLLAADAGQWLLTSLGVAKVVIGFSIIIFVHELGHFLAAKAVGVRVNRFAIGFVYRVVGWRKGEGLTFGPKPSYTPEQVAEKGWGETDYCLNALPFGGYVKMMGEDDIAINEQTGEIKTTTDPRAFTNKTVGQRLLVVSAGVVFNVLFAVLLYMLVYLFAGREVAAPVVGPIEPGSAAAKAGLQVGDQIVAVNGEAVDSFDDVGLDSLLSHGDVRFRVQRDGHVLENEIVVPLSRADSDVPVLGIQPMFTTRLGPSLSRDPDPQGLRPGDVVTHVNGRPVSNGLDIQVAFEGCGGRPVEFTVRRPDPNAADGAQVLTLPQRPRMLVVPTETPRYGSGRTKHLLGLVRRCEVAEVAPAGPAAKAGFETGDVIAQWGTVASPLYEDIVRSIEAAGNAGVPVVVEREGQSLTLSVVPKRAFSLFRSQPPRVGLAFRDEDRRPVVADVVPGTPAAELGLPRGAELVAIGERAVANWFDVHEALRAAAGTSVTVRYRSGADEVSGRMRIPASIVSALQLPPTARILSIAGRDSVETEKGRVKLPTLEAVRLLLEHHVGQTVPVEYSPSRLDTTRLAADVRVEPELVDLWPMRVLYGYELAGHFELKKTNVSAHGNPLRALVMGTQESWRTLVRVYRTVRAMLTPQGNVGVQQVSGPIGIVRIGVAQAQASFGELLYFLAFISVNLAVINFLPLPVVDGGLAVFLLLEKLRGRPLNMKVQVITTIAGLALIVLVFVLVTFQDIVKWMQGGI